MNPILEGSIVGIAILIAIAYLGRAGYRRIVGCKSCGDCSCGTKKTQGESASNVSLTINGKNHA